MKQDVTRSSVSTAAAIAAGVVFLVGISVWFFAQGGQRSESTTGMSEATASTTVPVTNPANEASGIEPENDENPFVGWWEATDLDGSVLNLRVDDEGTFSFWDSASKECRNEGFDHSPETWAGTATFTMSERPSFIDDMVGEGNNSEPTLTMSGAVTCHPYDSKSVDAAERSAVYFYDQAMDRLEPAAVGVRFKRSYPAQGVAVDIANPFVGSWEGTSGEGTHRVLVIRSNGFWESTDTRSQECEENGLTYSMRSGEGTGAFSDSTTPIYELMGSTYCVLSEYDRTVLTPNVGWRIEYRESTDTLVLLVDGTVFTRFL